MRVIAFDAAGVQEVYVTDDGIPTSCDDCIAVHGTNQSMAWGLANPSGHPFCRRELYPIRAGKTLGLLPFAPATSRVGKEEAA